MEPSCCFLSSSFCFPFWCSELRPCSSARSRSSPWSAAAAPFCSDVCRSSSTLVRGKFVGGAWRRAFMLQGAGGGVGARVSGADCLLPVPCARLLQPVGRLREVRGAGVPVQAPLRLLQEVRHRAGGVLLWNLTAPTHLFAPPFFFFGPFLFPAAPRTSPTASPSTSPMPLAP